MTISLIEKCNVKQFGLKYKLMAKCKTIKLSCEEYLF